VPRMKLSETEVFVGPWAGRCLSRSPSGPPAVQLLDEGIHHGMAAAAANEDGIMAEPASRASCEARLIGLFTSNSTAGLAPNCVNSRPNRVGARGAMCSEDQVADSVRALVGDEAHADLGVRSGDDRLGSLACTRRRSR